VFREGKSLFIIREDRQMNSTFSACEIVFRERNTSTSYIKNGHVTDSSCEKKKNLEEGQDAPHETHKKKAWLGGGLQGSKEGKIISGLGGKVAIGFLGFRYRRRRGKKFWECKKRFLQVSSAVSAFTAWSSFFQKRRPEKEGLRGGNDPKESLGLLTLQLGRAFARSERLCNVFLVGREKRMGR